MNSAERKTNRTSLGVLAAIIVGCSAPSSSAPAVGVDVRAKAAPKRTVKMHGQTLFPDSTMEDWITYADQIVVASAEGEREVRPDSDKVARGHMIARLVTMRVEEVLWERGGGRPSLATGEDFEFTGFGRIMRDGQELQLAADGAVQVETGGLYIVPLVRWEETGWGPLTPFAISPIKGSNVAEEDAAHNRSDNPVSKELMGLSRTQMKQRLAGTQPSPAAAQFMRLSPEERRQRVNEAEPGYIPPPASTAAPPG